MTYKRVDTKGIKNETLIETLDLIHNKGWDVSVVNDEKFPGLHDYRVLGTKEICSDNELGSLSNTPPKESFTLKFEVDTVSDDYFDTFCNDLKYSLSENEKTAENCSLPFQDDIHLEITDLNRLLDSQEREYQIRSLNNSCDSLKEQLQYNRNYPSYHNYYELNKLLSNIKDTCVDIARHDNPRFVIGMMESENFNSCRSREGRINLSHDLKMYFTPKEMLVITKACRDKYKFPSELESIITFIESDDGMHMPIEAQMLKNKQFDELMDVCKQQICMENDSFVHYDVFKNPQKENSKNKNIDDDFEK